MDFMRGRFSTNVTEQMEADRKRRQNTSKLEARDRAEMIRQLLAMYEAFKQSTDALFEAEISREERRTVLRNNELRKQLKNEKLTAQQREAINNRS